MTTPPTPVEMAFALVREGRLVDAEEYMMRELVGVTATYGHGSPAWASAQCDLGNVLLSGEQLDRAIECYRRAASAPAYENEARKDQLTYRLNLGMALRMAGRLDEAETELRQGVQERLAFYARADRIGRPELRSQVLRNWGLALREAGQAGPAEQRLAEAVAQARRSADDELVGRAGVALGLFLQHEGRLPEARALLEESLGVLDPVHPDAIIGRGHLGAVLDGRTCGCGDVQGSIADAFRAFVITRLPADLLARLDVAIADGDFQIKVELRREPTESEIERLNGVFRSAQAEFRRRLREPRYAG